MARGKGDGEGEGVGLPFLGEGARVTLKGVMVWGTRRRFIFFSRRQGRTMDILELAEFKSVRVEKRAQNKFTVP